jgi:sulfotransferase family protein
MSTLARRVARRLERQARRVALRHAMREQGYERLFGIGTARTGTSSLARALVLLGFKHTSWDPTLWDRYERGDYEPIFRVADRFESFDDGPWNGSDFYRELDRRYPRSKFVLSVREAQSWLVSHERHFSTEGARTIPERYLIPDYAARRDEILADYMRRNREAIDYFRHRPGDLLVLDVCGGEGWERLCPFLGLDPPAKPFPHINAAPPAG